MKLGMSSRHAVIRGNNLVSLHGFGYRKRFAVSAYGRADALDYSGAEMQF